MNGPSLTEFEVLNIRSCGTSPARFFDYFKNAIAARARVDIMKDMNATQTKYLEQIKNLCAQKPPAAFAHLANPEIVGWCLQGRINGRSTEKVLQSLLSMGLIERKTVDGMLYVRPV